MAPDKQAVANDAERLELHRLAAGIRARLRDWEEERPPTHTALVPGAARRVLLAMEALVPDLRAWASQAADVEDADAAIAAAKAAGLPRSIELELEKAHRGQIDKLEKMEYPKTNADFRKLIASYAALCELAAQDPFPPGT